MNLIGNAALDLLWIAGEIRVPRVRSLREFAEQELIIPDGAFKGRRFRWPRQPFTRLFLDEIDSGRWLQMSATGPSQSGKSLICFVLPILYLLFELKHNIGIGVQSKDMVSEKWKRDILPAIQAGRYRDQLPLSGPGSKGGDPWPEIRFRNGAIMRWMTAEGGEKSRASVTLQDLVATEVDGYDRMRAASKESTPMRQMIARLRANISRARVYKECTVTDEAGLIWKDYRRGTESRIEMPCVHCGEYVYLQREHLIGWQDAADVLEAEELARWMCPECGVLWTEQDRRVSAQRSVLLHRGQTVDSAGIVAGEIPRTDLFSFRWTAVDNMFMSAGAVGKDEWTALRDKDPEACERELCQFVHCIPMKVDTTPLTDLDARELLLRQHGEGRGEVPADTVCLTGGVDVHKRNLYWGVIAWKSDGTACVIDYGIVDIFIGFSNDEGSAGFEEAMLAGFGRLWDIFHKGWRRDNGQLTINNKQGRGKHPPESPLKGGPEDGSAGASPSQNQEPGTGNQEPGTRNQEPETNRMYCSRIVVDRGWMAEIVVNFCKNAGPEWFTTHGYGMSEANSGRYSPPKRKNSTIRLIGPGYHIARHHEYKCQVVDSNSDHWKSFLHARLETPVGAAGAMTFFYVPRQDEHFKLVKHLTAEQEVNVEVIGKGTVKKWEIKRDRANHYLDVGQYACLAGHMAKVRIVKDDAIGPVNKDGKRVVAAEPKVVRDWFSRRRKRK